jgi:hypothetical protein
MLGCCVVAIALGVIADRDAFAASGDGALTQQLFDAVHANDVAAVQASVGAGADIDARNQWGLTPVEIAIDKGHYQIAHFLASVRHFRRPGAGRPTPLHEGDAKPTPQPRTASQAEPVSAAGEAGAAAATPSFRTPLSRDRAPAPAVDKSPFDPGIPSPGSQLLVVGEAGSATAGTQEKATSR